jgi:hypothetical protein
MAGADARRIIPGEIPPRGWKDILWRAWGEVSEQNLFLIAGGVTYAVLLALFPGLAALVSLYGIVFDAGQIERQVAALSGVLPAQTQELLSQQLHSLVQASGGALGFAAIAGLLLALWSASRGMSGLITAINIAYKEKETRGFLRLNLCHRHDNGIAGGRHRRHRARGGPAGRRAPAGSRSCYDLAGDQPVEQRADGRQMLLDRRFLEIPAKRLDIGRHVQRLDVGKLADAAVLATGEEPPDGMQIGRAGVLVADSGGEEFQELARRLVAGVGDDRRHDDRRGDACGDPRLLGARDDGQLAVGFRLGGGHGFSVHSDAFVSRASLLPTMRPMS